MRHILDPHPIAKPLITYAVLGISALLEGGSWLVAVREFAGTMGDHGWWQAVRRSKDPPSFIVLFEDSAAMFGLVVAAAGIAMAQATGNRYLVDILTQLGTALIPRQRLDSAGIAHADPKTYVSQVNVEHESILDAITRQASEGARAAMRMHLTNSRERLRRANKTVEDGADLPG